MSVKYGKDYIYLVWKDIKTRRRYIVGELSKNGKFEFAYGFEVDEAIEHGFKLLISFEDKDKIYESDILFPVFSSRLPDMKRRGIDKILNKYGLEYYDDFKLLKRSGAKLPIDKLEFIDPILDENEDVIKRIFYLAGSRHYIGCFGESCNNSVKFNKDDKLKLELEPNNKFDKNAVKVLTLNNIHIGYIPRFYCESVVNLIQKGYNNETQF